MSKHQVRDTSGALAYLTDCTLATVSDLAMKKSASKSELRRQISIAQSAIDWMDQFGVDYSHTRAADVKTLGGKVEIWAERFKPYVKGKQAMTTLTNSQQLALNYLESKRPAFVSPTEIGREVGKQLGKEGRHSSFGTPLCMKLVNAGLAVRNEAGHYAAATK